MTTTTKPNHALTNCKGQLENIIELYKLSQQAYKEGNGNDERDFIQEATDMALDVCWKSDDWQAVGSSEGFTPTKGRVLLTTGGPA